jgi:hypothetical protein
MSDPSESSNSLWSRVGEDWWSVIIGLILALLVYIGVLGKIPW